MSESPRFVVLGAGAIGAGLGALLAQAGRSVVLVARGPHGAALASGGVDLRRPGGSARVAVPVGALAELRPTDVVLLCTMGQDTAAALAQLPPDQVVISLQNGLAPLEALRGRPAGAGVVYLPAERRAPGVVVLAGSPSPGAVFLGAWPAGRLPAVQALAEGLADAGLRARVLDPIAPWIRAKALTTLGGVFAALSDDPPRAWIEAAVAEARAVLAAGGEEVVPDEVFDAALGPMEVLPVDGLPRVGGSTRHALARGDRLETASLHGWFVERGAERGVPTPVNRALVALAERAYAERWTPGALRAEDWGPLPQG